MSDESKKKLLIVEDDIDLAEMLNAYFRMQGYTVASSPWGRKAIELASEQRPDLILLDIQLPDIDGYEVCKALRDSHLTRNIPILFLTERNKRDDRLLGLELGVVDYISKPFDIQELKLRIRNTLDRVTGALFENPVSGLPEGGPVDDMLESLLTDDDWSVLVVHLNGITAFRDLYGFVASDDVLRVTARTVQSAARDMVSPSVFCGHLDEHTFVVPAPVDKLTSLQKRILSRLEHSLKYFYPAENRDRNAHTKDRLSLTTGVLSSAKGPFTTITTLKEALIQSHHVSAQETIHSKKTVL